MKPRIVFIFLDGFGLAPPGPYNPFAAGAMPFLESVLGSPLVAGQDVSLDTVMCRGIDACLGVEGTPQSATGQTALFTGVNAARTLGRHYPAFPNRPLIDIIKRENIYRQAMAAGRRCLFANAYSSIYFELVQEKRRRHSVTTHCLLAAGLPILTLEDMKAGRAVFWDITRTILASYPIEEKFPIITGQAAGAHLAALSRDHELVVFECFLPDLLGHKKNMAGARDFLTLLDGFLHSIVDHAPEDATVVLSSDHGNMEDLSMGPHTLNPVPLLVLGPAAPAFAKVKSIVDVTPSILSVLTDD
jgi:2,3-bisphosphoglycerate-independent phosphoglycerate mutase